MISFPTLLASAIAVVLFPILALGQSDDDIVLGTLGVRYTREDLERVFRLKKESLVLPSDGRAFERAFQKSAWASYAGIGMQLSAVQALAKDENSVDPTTSNNLTILHLAESGLYYQTIFVGNKDEIAGQFVAIVGISGNQLVGCNYVNITEPPSPLVPILATDQGDVPCLGPFLADLNDATCTYAEDSATLAYDILAPLSLDDNPESSKLFYQRWWVSFSDLDVFADRDPKGNEWPKWILDNRDEFYWEGYTSYPCTSAFKRGKKWKKSSKSWKKRGRKRTSRGGELLGI